MSQTLTQKDSYKSLQTTFENTFGVKADRNAYNNYSKKYFTFITDRKGNSYYIDERTNKRVTTAYKKNLESKLTKSYKALQNIGKPIQPTQLKSDFNVLNKQSELSIAKSRGRFFPPAKEGDLPLKGDTPHKVFNAKGELVIKGGKKQYLKNKAILDAEEELRIAQEKSNDVNINRHRQALKVMGIESDIWQNPYYGDQRDYKEGGIYEGKIMPENTTKVTPDEAPTTGNTVSNEVIQSSNPDQNSERKLPASSVEQEKMNRARLKASAYLDKVGAGGRMTPQKLQALALVAPNSKTNAHTLAVRHYFRNDPRFKDKAWQKDFK